MVSPEDRCGVEGCSRHRFAPCRSCRGRLEAQPWLVEDRDRPSPPSDDFEAVADAADLFVQTFHGTHEGRAWTVEGAFAQLLRAVHDHQARKLPMPRFRAATEDELDHLR